MIVVADTTPINYLVLIGKIDVLKPLYVRTLIPPAVLAELKHPLAPESVRHWAQTPPDWVEIVSPKDVPCSAQLDLGEIEAIALALEVEADDAGLLVFEDAIAQLRSTSFRISEGVLFDIRRRRSG